MNKLFRLLSLLVLSIVLLPGCSKKQAAVDDSSKPLIIACEASTSPYCYYLGRGSNPPVAGVDIDIVEAIAKELGRPVQFKIVTLQQVLSLVEQGKADIGVAGITITPQRAGRVLFSAPYDVSAQVIVVPKGSSITDESMLANARVAAQEGTTNLDLLRTRIQPKYVMPFLTQEDINEALVNDQADAAVMDLMQAQLLVKTTGDTFKVLEKPLSEDKYGLAINKQNTALAETANKVIERLKKDNAIEKSRNKHFDAVNQLGNGAKVEDKADPFILCIESSFAPFVFWDDNHLVGIDIEIAEAIAAELKRPLVIQIVPFIDVIPLVESKAADMGGSGITITPERAERVLFSIPYEDGIRRILVRDDSPYKTIKDLDGRIIGAKKGTTNEAFAISQLNAKSTEHYDNAAQGILGLLNNEIDAYVDDESQADLAADKYSEIRILTMDNEIQPDEYGFVFPKDDAEVKAVADKIISEKRGNGEIEKLFNKYNTRWKEIDAKGF